MQRKLIYSILFFVFFIGYTSAQDDELIIKKDSVAVKKKRKPVKVFDQGIDPLSPARAAFYSAVLPGLGQMYNKKYWKAPIVWGAIGTGVYFYLNNSKEFDRYRTAYKFDLAGKPHEFDGEDGRASLSRANLERAQDFYRKNKDLSLFITIGLYALNILEANVDAHLPDKALDTRLSFKPTFFTEPTTSQPMFGASMSFNF